jgi:16S rRNA (guanine527-N7)-methyltransferase
MVNALTIRGPEEFAEVFKVPRETINRLAHYGEILANWRKRTNLVSASTLPELWSRHFADSAQLYALAPNARLWLDLGSGAGFPGLVVAIIQTGKPDFRMHLIEANQKKCAFLAEVARETKAPVDIHVMRIEDLAESAQSLKPDVVSARALAALPRLFELAVPFFGERTEGLFPKGREAETEIEAAQEDWDFGFRLHQSLTARDSHIIEVTGLQPRTTTRGATP